MSCVKDDCNKYASNIKFLLNSYNNVSEFSNNLKRNILKSIINTNSVTKIDLNDILHKSNNKDIFNDILEEYRIIKILESSENPIKNKFEDCSFIKTNFMYEAISSYLSLESYKAELYKDLQFNVIKHPMWDNFFKNVYGCGIILAAYCISYIDMDKCKSKESLFSFAGVSGNMSKKFSSALNNILLTSFIKQTLTVGNRSVNSDKICYANYYYEYKKKYECREDLKEVNKNRIKRMASRQCVKVFLSDMFSTWSKLLNSIN